MSKLSLSLLLLILSSLLIYRAYDYYRTLPVYHDGQQVKAGAFVTEEPKLSYGKQRVKMKTTEGVRVTVVTEAAPMFQYGDEVLLDGVFTKERYEDYEYWVSYFPKLQTVKNEHNIVTGAAYWVRNEAKTLFERTLPPAASSLLLGIVLGGKHGMPDDFLENLRSTGVMHVIAASGMNISFVAVFLVAVLGNFFSRRLTLFTTVLGIGFYVVLAGFEPSIVRAAIMSTLAFSAAFLGRQSAAIWVLCITGYIMLLVSPGLWEDVGFQLSFLSTLGILTVKPVLEGVASNAISLKRDGTSNVPLLRKNIFWMNEDVTTTSAAQLATLPILLGVFGSYGILSVIVNACILWTIPVLMALGSLAIILGIIFAPFGQLVLFLALPFLWFFETVVTIFGSGGWVLEIPAVPVAVWMGYYLVMAAVVLGNRKKVMARKETLVLREA